MAGPVELEFETDARCRRCSRTRRHERAAIAAKRRSRQLRLPAESRRRRSHAPRGRGGGPRQSRHRQYLRRHRRSGAPGAPDDPPAEARSARSARSSSPAAPRRSIAAAFAAMPEVAQVLGNAEKLEAEAFAPLRDGRVAVGDIFAASAAPPLAERHRGSHPRLSRHSDRLRSSLHLLHHSLWPRRVALDAGRQA